MKCPCGSDLDLEDCCSPYIDKGAVAPTVEKLMRARYTAYTQKNIDYIMNTQEVPPEEWDETYQATSGWAKKAQWLGLEILKVREGGEEDSKGTVEFKARYMMERERHLLHELSHFEKRDGHWILTEGRQISGTYRRGEPKVNRNDPCPCGSGKKYKKCCG